MVRGPYFIDIGRDHPLHLNEQIIELPLTLVQEHVVNIIMLEPTGPLSRPLLTLRRLDGAAGWLERWTSNRKVASSNLRADKVQICR